MPSQPIICAVCGTLHKVGERHGCAPRAIVKCQHGEPAGSCAVCDPASAELSGDEFRAKAAARPLADFDAAIKMITDDRGEVYGHPSLTFDRIARLHEVVRECKDPILRHALEMICVKMGRLIASPTHMDSWVDIVGYARCGAMVLDARKA